MIICRDVTIRSHAERPSARPNKVALQTRKALRAEGAAMHHCIASYWQNVVTGRSRIYSILERQACRDARSHRSANTIHGRPNVTATDVRGSPTQCPLRLYSDEGPLRSEIHRQRTMCSPIIVTERIVLLEV
jgi:hypothetical protein